MTPPSDQPDQMLFSALCYDAENDSVYLLDRAGRLWLYDTYNKKWSLIQGPPDPDDARSIGHPAEVKS